MTSQPETPTGSNSVVGTCAHLILVDGPLGQQRIIRNIFTRTQNITAD